jgi:hypothetical protein
VGNVIVEKIGKLLAGFISIITLFDFSAFIVAVAWLAYEGLWSVIGWGLVSGFGFAFGLSIAMTLLMILLMPSIFLMKKGKTFLSYTFATPFLIAIAIVLSLFYIYVFNFFSEYASKINPIALLLWSYCVSTGALGAIGSSAKRNESYGFGLLVLFSKLGFLLMVISMMFGGDKFMSFGISVVMNMVGITVIVISSIKQKSNIPE